jgi:hypothetical protein
MKKIYILVFALLCFPLTGRADEPVLRDLCEEIVHIPVTIDGFWSKKEIQLIATTYRPQGTGHFPLIVLNHGSTTSISERMEIGRFRVIPQIREFIRRGFAVIVPIRRGYSRPEETLQKTTARARILIITEPVRSRRKTSLQP